MKTIFFFYFLSVQLFAQEQLDIVLHYGLEKTDTLKIHSNPIDIQYHCLWKGDTIISEWSHSGISDIISSMAVWGLQNSFLLAAYAGDGCPVIYYIITLKDDGTWFVSEAFGNCESFSNYQVKSYTQVEFSFPAFAEAKRKKEKVLFDAENLILTKK